MAKWVKVYFTKRAYDDLRNGKLAIGYTEDELNQLKSFEKRGFDSSLKSDPVDNMTKVDPARISKVGWSYLGVYVQ